MAGLLKGKRNRTTDRRRGHGGRGGSGGKEYGEGSNEDRKCFKTRHPPKIKKYKKESRNFKGCE